MDDILDIQVINDSIGEWLRSHNDSLEEIKQFFIDEGIRITEELEAEES